MLLVVSLLDLKFNFILKHHYFVMVPVAVGAGLALDRVWQRGWYFGGVTVDPLRADTVYEGNTSLYRSDDGGRTFTPVEGSPGGDDYHELWIDPEAPVRRILGTDQGAVVSLNGGRTWSSWYNQPIGQMYHVVTDTRFPYWLYGAQQDSGAVAVPSPGEDPQGLRRPGASG